MENLQLLREKIDKIDGAIIKKLAMRQKLSKKIGLIKTESGKPVRDRAREKFQKQQYEKLCSLYQIDSSFVTHLFAEIIEHSRGLQKDDR